MTEETPDLLRLEDQVCFALAIASRSVIGVYRPVLEPYGLTHPQYLVMLALWGRSPRSVTDLAAELRLEPATLSPLLKRLETAGLVSRTRNDRDERMLDVALTDDGLRLRDEAATIPPRIIDSLGMSAEELEALRRSLWRVIDATHPG
ncbi:MarR family transcriptional regulator [Cryobacterium sp. PH31-AA6]|uniref:MarR family winged helix-turn-helix transcriptional regulator n=1 Tax=Cryobacterium sp. PH31-AA6 TaxID=3046205 RepID=UPI0024BB6EB5|nr:MarR family transcriptional regulator [Cryobacterium sp. PH31-AA6]MDJ0324936.1 MarR family transcriptional regulator [Cryobacterium sp. PH31-AA6]